MNKTFNLTKWSVNTRSLNGWNVENKKLYDSLTNDEQVLANKLIMDQFEFLAVSDRVKFPTIYKLIKEIK